MTKKRTDTEEATFVDITVEKPLWKKPGPWIAGLVFILLMVFAIRACNESSDESGGVGNTDTPQVSTLPKPDSVDSKKYHAVKEGARVLRRDNFAKDQKIAQLLDSIKKLNSNASANDSVAQLSSGEIAKLRKLVAVSAPEKPKVKPKRKSKPRQNYRVAQNPDCSCPYIK